MGRKVGAAVSPFWVELGLHLTQCRLVYAYLRTKWHINPSSRLATTNMGRKLAEGCGPLRGAGFPSNTVWPGPMPTCVSSFIVIHPTVWKQYTNVTDRQDRQPAGYRDRTDTERFDSIGRTVFRRPFVKRFARCYGPLSCLSCL